MTRWTRSQIRRRDWYLAGSLRASAIRRPGMAHQTGARTLERRTDVVSSFARGWRLGLSVATRYPVDVTGGGITYGRTTCDDEPVVSAKRSSTPLRSGYRPRRGWA